MTTLTAPQSAAQDNPTGGRLTPLRRRLRRVSGQVLGIERMLAENRSCEDVLIQLAGVQGACAVAQQVLATHLTQPVPNGRWLVSLPRPVAGDPRQGDTALLGLHPQQQAVGRDL